MKFFGVTDVSCDASEEWTSSAASDDEHTSSDSAMLDCSVATCREVTDRDVTGHVVSPTASQLADSLESAPPQ
ncbi:hypothetical protein FJT64_001495 [Amphibalanus amphitrite]|uniref:Uncharacterized protein n=1 Tax=Amphibalanus amphitrite TaxID=1232801 RepID=A0A6A4V6G6_AMPAM|nr:hypothetical protein FJT64_001495 [Amphibalanus amphitrite]